MAWYWILLIGIGYFVLGGLTAQTIDYFEDIGDEAILSLLMFFWPAALIAIALYVIYSLFAAVSEWIVCGVINLIEDIRLKLSQKDKRSTRSKHNKEEEPSSIIDDIDYVRRSK